MAGSRRQAGRPVTPVLSRERIAQAALELVTLDGADTLTMAALARHLGVAASALYNHIGGKAELTALLQDAVMGRVDVSSLEAFLDGSGSLAAALADWGRSYREVFAAHPTLIPLIATLPISGAPTTRGMYDVVAAALSHAGVPDPRVVPVIIAFESFLFGSAMDVHAPASIFTSRPGESDAPNFQRTVDSFMASLAAGDQGTGAAGQDAVPEAAQRNPYADAPFELGLDALIHATLRLVP
ncbi:TetR/AcrR family transcriptional regulator [Micrococcus sp. TA1]|uniref:TetR/AcrR family transcriptional regulator n=2 Tax=Micrococcaceae TaxID=1268 RepID=UPI00160DDCAB|nr:TetR/AcrR family transcriptional regulator [Micrococcus sp. TA1]MBB5749910.1 AcrR family transcriptional regulator [Micrococcus sp. TA1]